MHYIVDGYNVINSDDMFVSNTLENRRNILIKFIREFRPHGSLKNSISVIFDSKSKNLCQTRGYSKICMCDIEVIFSDGVLSADDIIVEIVDMSENPYNITVVTNDRGIIRRIGASGAKHESVEVFLSKRAKHDNVQKVREFDIDVKNDINKEFEKLWLKK
ncbi:MAG: NYN domain-containing protein [Endomicrobium sp.]|jgi:predicted RNA-binding protein with PIN domain|nr:NYN domain-containing protein [Endomicrobium sp.]